MYHSVSLPLKRDFLRIYNTMKMSSIYVTMHVSCSITIDISPSNFTIMTPSCTILTNDSSQIFLIANSILKLNIMVSIRITAYKICNSIIIYISQKQFLFLQITILIISYPLYCSKGK